MPQYTVEATKGGMRATTLRDARKLNLVPSVTTILNVASKPALTAWLQQQVLLSALTLPKRPDETDKDYCDRIIKDSKETGRSAADAGTAIHASVQSFYEGGKVTQHQEHVNGVVTTVASVFGVQNWVSERAFSHDLGFGGKCDMYLPRINGFEGAENGVVLDVKTKEFSDPDKVEGYDEHLMQLSAYRVGLGVPQARCANVFVSRSVAGLAVVKEWSEGDLARGWEMFVRLLEFWQLKNQHK